MGVKDVYFDVDFFWFYGAYVVFTLLLVVVLTTITVSLGLLFKTPSSELEGAYECGFVPFSEARLQFDVSFYIFAILFIVFDLEVIFFFPYIVITHVAWFSELATIGLFLIILGVGFLVEFKIINTE